VQELAVRGILEKDKSKILQAVLLDPFDFRGTDHRRNKRDGRQNV